MCETGKYSDFGLEPTATCLKLFLVTSHLIIFSPSQWSIFVVADLALNCMAGYTVCREITEVRVKPLITITNLILYMLVISSKLSYNEMRLCVIFGGGHH